MRVPHRNARHSIFFSVNSDRLCNESIQIGIYRDIFRDKNCFSHVHFYAFDLVVSTGIQCQILDAGIGFQRYLGFIGHAHIIDVLADTSGGIAAHHCLRTVSVENTHPEVRNLRRQNKYQTIRTDAESDITQKNG